MTKLPFKINTDITLRDLMDFAEFKLRIAGSEKNEDVQLLLRTQAAELQLICDHIVKSAIENTVPGGQFLAGYQVPSMLSMDGQRLMQMVQLTKRALPSFSAVMNNPTLPFNIKDAKVIVESQEGGKEITSPNTEGKELEEMARLILTKKYGENESDDEYIKMVKDTVISAMKKKVDTDPESKTYGQPINGRLEAINFLKNYAFKSLNWNDTEAHMFLNRLKEVEEIYEPSKKEKLEESERILAGQVK